MKDVNENFNSLCKEKGEELSVKNEWQDPELSFLSIEKTQTGGPPGGQDGYNPYS